ncbi:Transposase IS200 like protein [Botrimarina colliarenosi]|uniref:Transposase IS200 like protein n=1 Tax=Botrimarina colliarenosi TaxID=2528001 RepID=A0A5C6A915_9BACT|nr:IS200/IS605 family transposase [Botrimarina colliarenosi]TWT95916.1 Transposase IS200 like protein [Botrimarina colliarenosi]
MSQSLANVILHVVFSTKQRQPFIDGEIESELHAYLGGVAKSLGCIPYAIGGVEDHVHLACSLPRTVTIADLVQDLKQGSSKWIKTRGAAYASFAWQNGYGAFSVGHSQLPDLCLYISNQHERHRRASFEDELRTILHRYEIAYDERYVWD